jgi:excisionase family DNA binding protein
MNTRVLQREFLTVREAAARWRVAEKTVRRWINEGELVALQPAPGHALRIPADALEAQLFRDEAEVPAERRETHDRGSRLSLAHAGSDQEGEAHDRP